MPTWKYKAVDLTKTARPTTVGEMAAESAVEVRGSLRRIGLQVIDIRPARTISFLSRPDLNFLTDRMNRYLRTRRRSVRAELFDSLATMLESGVPLLDAVSTLIQSNARSGRARNALLRDIRESLRTGSSFSQAITAQNSWFDQAECAMINAGQASGQLAEVLRQLADHSAFDDELSQKLAGALAYPVLVSIMGLGVTVYLSTQTLPQLTSMLVEHDIEIPRLTATVMTVGSFLSKAWIFAIPSAIAGACAAWFIPNLLRRHLPTSTCEAFDRRTRIIRYPDVRRKVAIAHVCTRLSDLLRSGVTMVESLRILAPTVRHHSLRSHLQAAADRIEQGDDVATALRDDFWVDPELERLLDVGQQSGELAEMSATLGQRYARQSRRLIERLAGILEPIVILILATLIGIVVMGAILPIIRLQEIV